MRLWARRIAVACIWLAVIASLAAFALPWAHVSLDTSSISKRPDLAGVSLQELSQRLEGRVGRVMVTVHRGDTTTIARLSALSDIPSTITGAQIPPLARRRNTQAIVALFGLLAESPDAINPDDVRRRSALVYLVPTVAMVCGLLALGLRRALLLRIAIGFVCLTVAGFGVWRLQRAETHVILASITVGIGLWLSCAAYAVLGLSSMTLAALERPAEIA